MVGSKVGIDQRRSGGSAPEKLLAEDGGEAFVFLADYKGRKGRFLYMEFALGGKDHRLVVDRQDKI